jgi:hypothetical protein
LISVITVDFEKRETKIAKSFGKTNISGQDLHPRGNIRERKEESRVEEGKVCSY